MSGGGAGSAVRGISDSACGPCPVDKVEQLHCKAKVSCIYF